MRKANIQSDKVIFNPVKLMIKEKGSGRFLYKLRKIILGSKEHNGLLNLAVNYIILGGIGFLFIYPIIYMIVNSVMSPEDLVNPATTWIPIHIYFGNFTKAFKTLNFWESFKNSIVMSLIPALLQLCASAVIGYGLARFDFPLKRFWMVLIVSTYIIPSQVTMIPRYVLFSKYKLINTPWASFLPDVFGQGIKGAIFILIFYQFFNSYPRSLDEAAQIDGARKINIFLRIAIPMAKPAIVVSILFSFVWYWNETTQSGLLFGTVIKTLPMKLGSFAESYKSLYNSGASDTVNALNEAVSLAGTFLSILPLMVMYLILQKQFVESIERTGITGE